MAIGIRPATAGDGDRLRAVERAAGERFREIGMPEVADDEPPTVDALAGYATDGRSWVATADDTVVGYVLVDLVDGAAHVEQLSVHPDHQGQGVGRALLDHVARWADGLALPWVTLTTFTDVPWNAPLYRHLGFAELTDRDLGPGLRAIVAAEAAHDLDPARRAVMRRAVGGS